ncbi:uncharacterized protein [Argopecten irradians]|uniref:uncharacterized protein n=1 Tax=Argopecten irradians TaxID=31199 RepID=UPI00371CB58B
MEKIWSDSEVAANGNIDRKTDPSTAAYTISVPTIKSTSSSHTNSIVAVTWDLTILLYICTVSSILRGAYHAKAETVTEKHRLAKSDAIFWDIKEVSGNTHKDENASRIGIATISNRRPTPQELGRLSRLVDASQCDRLFVELGLPLPEVQQTKFEARSLAGITVITKMFLKWTNTYPNQTLSDIKEAMATVDMATDRINEVLEKNEDLTDQDIVPIDVWTRAPSDEEIKRIVPNIGNTFYNLCLELGLSPPIIEQHEIGHPITFQSRMCALLQCWVNEFKTDATIGSLLIAMKACRIDWYTTAQILSQESGASESSEDRASWFRCGIL